MNILSHYYNFPVVELGKEIVLHLKGAPQSRLDIEGERILFDGEPPVVVHFNGTSERKLLEEIKVERSEGGRPSRRDYLARRASHRISRMTDSRAVRSLADVDVPGVMRRVARRVLPERVWNASRDAFRTLRR